MIEIKYHHRKDCALYGETGLYCYGSQKDINFLENEKSELIRSGLWDHVETVTITIHNYPMAYLRGLKHENC